MSHKSRQEQKSWTKHICDEPSCEFYNQGTVQGVCHSDEGDLCDFAKLDKHEAEIMAYMKEWRERYGDAYIEVLESHYVCTQLNETMIMDECVRLRRDNALLRHRLAKIDPTTDAK